MRGLDLRGDGVGFRGRGVGCVVEDDVTAFRGEVAGDGGADSYGNLVVQGERGGVGRYLESRRL